MFALLAALTLLVVTIPMLPALIEWQWPSDIVPLSIDETDALDPSFLAHRFHDMLKQALAAGATHLGKSELAVLSHGVNALPWPLSAKERAQRASQRLWHVDGDAELPPEVAFHVEVAATGALRSAPGGVCRALWSSKALHLSTGSTVLRWAHGHEVVAQTDCALSGRVTATDRLTLAGRVSFTLLHAPTIHFMPLPQRTAQQATPGATAVDLSMDIWPAGLVWDRDQRRGFSKGAVSLPPASAWMGDVVSIGDMELGAGCEVTGSLRTHGRLRLGNGCRISGSVFADGEIQIEAGCVVKGAVVSEIALELASDCHIGAPGKAATMAAPRIQVAGNVTVHGTVWAAETGWTVDVLAAAPVGDPKDRDVAETRLPTPVSPKPEQALA